MKTSIQKTGASAGPFHIVLNMKTSTQNFKRLVPRTPEQVLGPLFRMCLTFKLVCLAIKCMEVIPAYKLNLYKIAGPGPSSIVLNMKAVLRTSHTYPE